MAERKTVLVVSYDREYHDLFATALSLVGYRVLRTTDGQDALGIILSKRPSLVILQYPVKVGESTLTASIRARTGRPGDGLSRLRSPTSTRIGR